MNESNALLTRFEAQRSRLRALAYRMLGSPSDADDAIQETWLRLARSDGTALENLGGWLTTVVSHVCLDMLRARKVRGEDLAQPSPTAQPAPHRTARSPEDELALADSVSAALLVVLDRLSPAERVAFVLHDMFDLNFDEIAPIVERTPEAARQLASRARRRVRGDDPATETVKANRERQRAIVEAFLAASKGGDLQALIAALDPGAVFRADATASRMGGGIAEVRGAEAIASRFKGRAQAAQPVLIDGEVGVIVAPRGRLRLLLRLGFHDGRISEIEAVADPDRLAAAELAAL